MRPLNGPKTRPLNAPAKFLCICLLFGPGIFQGRKLAGAFAGTLAGHFAGTLAGHFPGTLAGTAWGAAWQDPFKK